jgi:diguanylate cyclase (GGDEF)-like protein
MSESRSGGWMTGRPVAIGRWASRLRGAELSPEVTVLIVFALVTTAGATLASLVPVGAQQPTALLRAMAAAGALFAIGLFAAGPRLPNAALHGTVVAFTFGATVLTSNAHTAAGWMMAARSFQWLAVYVALFLPQRPARWHALAITIGCLVSVAVTRLPGTAVEAVIVCATIWVAVLLLGALAERLRAQADGDHLTGLLNRAGFAKAAEREHALAGRTGAPLALAVLDLDGFKHVNDAHGHAAGDRMLCELAEAWTRTLRPGDLIARFGGDEFVVLFPATAAPDANEALQRLRGAHPAQWSAGVTEWRPQERLEDCLARADRHLYEAKAARQAPLAAVSSAAPA